MMIHWKVIIWFGESSLHLEKASCFLGHDIESRRGQLFQLWASFSVYLDLEDWPHKDKEILMKMKEE